MEVKIALNQLDCLCHDIHIVPAFTKIVKGTGKKKDEKVLVNGHWSKEVKVNDYLIVEAYRILDPETYTDVYNDYYLKKYCTALLKRQWGANLIKFEGMVMPGGVTFNGRQLFDDANEELQKLEEEVRLNWEQPVDFYMG